MLMRKLGHIPEYLLLGMSSTIAFKRWKKAGLFCMGVSFADEIVKGCLPGRELDFEDMGFDFIGYVIGIALIIMLFKKFKFIIPFRSK